MKREECERTYTDKMSGKRFDRPEFLKMLEVLRSGDILVIWRLDRLGRSLKELIEIVTMLAARGVELKSLKEHIDTSTPTGKLMFHIMAALAEFERDSISERTQAGLEAARARGKRGGRPKGDQQAISWPARACPSALRRPEQHRRGDHEAHQLHEPRDVLQICRQRTEAKGRHVIVRLALLSEDNIKEHDPCSLLGSGA